MKEFRFVCDGCGDVTPYAKALIGMDRPDNYTVGWRYADGGEAKKEGIYCPACWAKMLAAIPMVWATLTPFPPEPTE